MWSRDGPRRNTLASSVGYNILTHTETRYDNNFARQTVYSKLRSEYARPQ
jgi:hypothetical protein